jgi:hypothetical protein
MKRALVFPALIATLACASAAAAQTCGGSLSCSSPSAAYTFSNSGSGQGLMVKNTAASGAVDAIFAQENDSATGSAAVYGSDAGACSASSLSLAAAGVEGASVGNYGVIGYTATGIAGVAGYNWESSFCSGSANVAGFLGYKSGTNNYGVYAQGNVGATGTKSFVEPHPTDPTKEIRYVSLEGPEAGTYFRGSGHTVNGVAVIEVPESFRMVTHEHGLTVVVTPIGELAQIACVSKGLDRIVVKSSRDVSFDYVVNGVRRAFKDFEAIGENSDFVPQSPTDNRFFGLPAESQRRLVATGIYTADGQVNLEKAHEMGWDRQWAERKAVAEILALAARPKR